MKTLIVGLPATFFIWVVVFFVYSFRVEDSLVVSDMYFINEQLVFVESTNDLMMLNCSLMHRRNDFDSAQLDLIGREIELVQREQQLKHDSFEHIFYKIEIDSSVLKNRNHEREQHQQNF